MSLFRSLDVSASGLTAQRLRMDTLSNNLANVNTTRTDRGEPYRRQMPVFAARPAFDARGNYAPGGVRVMGITHDDSPLKLVYEPGHPDADADGYVRLPNVNVVTEMVDMISASRAYEANLAAINAVKGMAMKALEIGRG